MSEANEVERVVMCEDCAVFFYNEEGELEQLTVWLTKEKARMYRDSKTFFSKRKKVVLTEVE